MRSSLYIISALKEEIPTIKAEIIGRGPEKESLVKLINSSDLADNLEIVDQLTREEVLQKMTQTKCFLHCSVFESFGMVLIEALSQGAQVIAKEVGIAAEHKHIKLYNTPEDAIEKIKNALTSQNESYPRTYAIEDTVDLYVKKVFLER